MAGQQGWLRLHNLAEAPPPHVSAGRSLLARARHAQQQGGRDDIARDDYFLAVFEQPFEMGGLSLDGLTRDIL